MVAVADRRSFRQAAAACQVSQPTLSTQVKKLEAELGAVLVDRSATPLALTPAGERVVLRARIILDDIRQLREVATGDAGRVRLGLFPTLGPYLLSSIGGRLRDCAPETELLLTEEKTSDLLALLEAGALDAALVALPDGTDRFETLPLFREEFVLAMPSGHPLVGESRLDPALLAGHEVLLLSAGHCLADQVASWLGEVGAVARRDHRATSLETMRHMIAVGGGISLLPALAAVSDVPGIATRRFGDPIPSRDIALVWRSGTPTEATLRRLAPCLVPAGALLTRLLEN